MKKNVYLTIMLWLSAIAAYSQYSIKGVLLDGATRLPIDFANVTLYKPDDTVPLTGNSTDENGKFELKNIANGTYKIVFSFIGYTEKEQTFTVENKAINLGKIYLEEDNKMLQEVEVVAQGTTMRFELDRKVFSVDQNIASAGGAATDVLENIPSVEVDNEGNISLRNNENVEVWINGKPSGLTAENRAQILQQLPADNIEEIEIITNPSAKYSPEGTAGVINLVMKKNRKGGYYGSANAGILYPWGDIPGGMAGINFNYSKGIVDTYINVGYRQMRAVGSSMSDRYNYNATDTTRLYQSGENNRTMGGIFTRAGVDVRITDNSSIGFSGFGMFANKSNQDNNIHYWLSEFPSDTALRNYERLETATGHRPSYNFSLDYNIDFTKAHNLFISASTRNFMNDNTSIYTQNDLVTGEPELENSQEQYSNGHNNTWEFKADYTYKITEGSRLEAGWQTTLQNNLSNSGATDRMTGEEIAAYKDKFEYNEQRHAAYITYGNRFFDKLSAQVGLRTEYMMRQTATLDVPNEPKSYLQLFPSAYLSYVLPQEDEIQLNYTRRIDRPRGRQINPFRDFSDSTNISYGNGDLLPEFSSALELNYLKNWESGQTLSGGLFYRFTDDVIQNVRYVNDMGVMENTYINVSQSQRLGVELVSKNRLFKNFLQLTTSLSGYYSTMDAAEYTFNNAATVYIDAQRNFAWRARINAMMMFGKDFSGQITGRYSSPQLVIQGKTTHMYAIDLGLRKTFFDKKLGLNFSVRDILNSRNRSSERWGDNFYQISENRFMGRHLNLMLTYNFGNMKPKQSKPNREASDAYGGDSEANFED